MGLHYQPSRLDRLALCMHQGRQESLECCQFQRDRLRGWVQQTNIWVSEESQRGCVGFSARFWLLWGQEAN